MDQHHDIMERKMANAPVLDKTKEVAVPENPRPGRNPSLADYVIARLADGHRQLQRNAAIRR
jgi:hypothetical protein